MNGLDKYGKDRGRGERGREGVFSYRASSVSTQQGLFDRRTDISACSSQDMACGIHRAFIRAATLCLGHEYMDIMGSCIYRYRE